MDRLEEWQVALSGAKHLRVKRSMSCDRHNDRDSGNCYSAPCSPCLTGDNPFPNVENHTALAARLRQGSRPAAAKEIEPMGR
jgi:hypothetical protein